MRHKMGSVSHFGKFYSENETNETLVGPFELSVSFLQNVTVHLTVQIGSLLNNLISEILNPLLSPCQLV